MSTLSGLAMIMAVGLSTYLFRSGVILFIGNRPLPDRFVRTLQSVAPAVLSALIVTMIADGEGVSGIELPEILALAVGSTTARLSKNLILGLVAGMTVFWGLDWLL